MSEVLLENTRVSNNASPVAKPKLGFLGVGWIGRNRLDAIAAQGAGEVAYVAAPVPKNTADALKSAPAAVAVDSLKAMLAEPTLEGVVIATPSALHAAQSI